MRLTVLIAVSMLAVLATAACDSSTEPEPQRAKTGATAELAIELPLVFPPDPGKAYVDTEWWVIQGAEFWFQNLSQGTIDLELMVTNPFTSESHSVGDLQLGGSSTGFIRLNKDFTTSDYRYHSWLLRYAKDAERENIAVRFGS